MTKPLPALCETCALPTNLAPSHGGCACDPNPPEPDEEEEYDGNGMDPPYEPEDAECYQCGGYTCVCAAEPY